MITKQQEFFTSQDVTICKFGNGDIAVGGIVIPETKKVAMVLYNLNQSVNIGEDIEDRENFEEIKLDVVMEFDKKASIDVLIERLINLKKELDKLNYNV